jgi:hypothetical protein
VVRVLEADDSHTRLWRDGWLLAFGAAAVGQGVVALASSDPRLRVPAIVGGAKSTLGFLSVLVGPASAHPRSAASDVRLLPDRTPDERRAALRAAEARLASAAEEERLRRSWVTLIGGALVNLAGAYVSWIGYKQYATGWIGLGLGLAVSQTQFHTQPTEALRADSRRRLDVSIVPPFGLALVF